jgi:transposase
MNKKIELHKDTIRIQYDNGKSVKEIADLHYVHPMTVYRHLKEMKIQLVHPFLRDGNKDKLKKMYVDRKYSIREISKRCNVSRKIVIDAIKKFEIKRLNPSKGKGVKHE